MWWGYCPAIVSTLKAKPLSLFPKLRLPRAFVLCWLFHLTRPSGFGIFAFFTLPSLLCISLLFKPGISSASSWWSFGVFHIWQIEVKCVFLRLTGWHPNQRRVHVLLFTLAESGPGCFNASLCLKPFAQTLLFYFRATFRWYECKNRQRGMAWNGLKCSTDSRLLYLDKTLSKKGLGTF